MSLIDRHIVLVEDDATMGHSLVQRLELEGARVTWVKQMVRGISAVRTPHHPVDAVVCDIRLPDGTGEEIFETVSRTATPPPFLFITGQGDIDQAVRLLRAGAADYLTKPFDIAALLQRLQLTFRDSDEREALPELVGISPLALEIEAQVTSAAKSDQPVLIKGQRGLGKARIARRICDLSEGRGDRQVELNGFEQLDQGALPANAFSTIILTSVDQLEPHGQDILMGCLRDPQHRIIAIAEPSLETLVEEGAFREDLYFALMANEIVVPPLRQRPDDVVWLAQQFFNALNGRRTPPLRGLSELSLSALRDHDWPGNGREVRARILRAISAATDEWVRPTDLFPELAEGSDEFLTLSEARDMAERRQIRGALERSDGQMAEAARLLGVSRTTLWEKMQKLDLKV
ncbi:MAG: response regulator [Pseudomonadota bacterium]